MLNLKSICSFNIGTNLLMCLCKCLSKSKKNGTMTWWIFDWLTPVHPGKHHVNLFPFPDWRHSSGLLLLQPFLASFPVTHQLFIHSPAALHRLNHSPGSNVAVAPSSSLPSAVIQKLSIHQHINYSTKESPHHEEKDAHISECLCWEEGTCQNWLREAGWLLHLTHTHMDRWSWSETVFDLR